MICKMIYTHVFWDFNGTIYDDVGAGFETINVLLERYDLPRLATVNDYQNTFAFPIIDYYESLGFDFKMIDFDKLAVEWLGLYLKNSADSGLYPDVKDTILRLRALGARQIIFSASEMKTLENQLRSLGIEEYFDDVLANDNARGDGKAALGLEYIKKKSPEKSVLIGDTTHDFEAAEAMGIDCVLIARGHQSKKVLLKTGALVFDNLSGAVDYISTKI